MRTTLVCAAMLAAHLPVSAACAFQLATGKGYISNIPTERVDARLNTDYTFVDTTVRERSTVSEIGVECALGAGFAVSLSRLFGLRASVGRDLYLKGYQSDEVSVSAIYLGHIEQYAVAKADRLSLVGYADAGILSPYLRIGVERIDAVHRVEVPIGGLVLSKEMRKSVTAPYLGAGIAFWRDRPISLRIEWQYESLRPHLARTIMLGIDAKFAF